jgi:hypothetical protein
MASVPRDVYALEKVWLALDCLATSAAPIQARLHEASLALITVKAEDFSDAAARTKYGPIRETLRPPKTRGGEGNLAATVNAMSDEQAVAVAKAIYELAAYVRS